MSRLKVQRPINATEQTTTAADTPESPTEIYEDKKVDQLFSKTTSFISSDDMRNWVKLLQAPLHHAKGASAVHSKQAVWSDLDIMLIQEPWSIKGRIKGLPNQSCKLIYNNAHKNPRTSMLLNKHTFAFPISDFVTWDLVAVGLEAKTAQLKQEVVFASAYFPTSCKI